MVLNPRLFEALERRFGKGNVALVAEGEEFEGEYEYDPILKRESLRRDRSGEEMRVSCPFCSDTRKRLYFNHTWGQFDGKSRRWHLVQCWNAHCTEDWNNLKRLIEDVGRTFQYADDDTPEIALPKPGRRKRLMEVHPPGPIANLATLADRAPLHPCVRYVESRLFCPRVLGEAFGVGYCVDSLERWAGQRLYVPIEFRRKLVGWQTRSLNPAPPDNEPRWYTMPDFHRGEALYNYLRAKSSPLKILVEGAPACWRLPECGMAILGSKITKGQMRLLKKAWREGDALVVMLDPKQSEQDKDKGRRHQIDQALLDLAEENRFYGRFAAAWLPESHGGKKLDPADFAAAYLIDMALDALSRAKVRFKWRPPSSEPRKSRASLTAASGV